MTRQQRSSIVWGVLSILAGGVMAAGGVIEVIAYWPQREILHVVVGAIGAVVSAFLLVSGIGFCTSRFSGRQTSIAGATGMISIHLLGVIVGFIGVSGGLLGIAYPALLLFVLRARPNLGAPTYTEAGPRRIGLRPPSDSTMHRAAVGAI